MVYTFSAVDVKEYISSGILESVVLGFASDQERQEVSCLMHIYPEIKTEMMAIEIAFEKMAFDTAVKPAAEMKARVLSSISKEKQLPSEKQEYTEETKIVQMAGTSATSEVNPWKWVAAASVVLFIGAASLWITTNNQSNALSDQLAAARKEQIENAEVLTAMKIEQERTNSIQAVLTEKSTKNIKMAGMPKDPTASVKIMWSDNENKAVMLAENITAPPTDMQYQLWAIADGKPVSLGIFDYDEVTNMTDPFEVSMNNISAFAITMEKRGGSPVPTMENMIVMGAVNS